MPIRRSIFWVTLQFLLLLSIELSSLAVLARILTPKDLGQFAVAVAAIRFFQFLGNFGMFAVVVRADSMARADLQRVVMITLTASGLSGLVALAVAYGAPASLFDVGIQELLRIMSPVVIPASFGTVMAALVIREFRFRALMAMRMCGAVAFPALAIPLALLGHGAASLAFGQALSALSFSLMAMVLTSGRFLVRPRLSGTREMVRFAATLFTANVLLEAAEAALPSFIGRALGLSSLGLFSRARDFVLRANQALTEIVVPALIPHVFRVRRDGGDLTQAFLTGLTNLTVISLPIAGVLSLVSPWVIRLLLGPQWGNAAPILGVLAVGLAMTSTSAFANIFALAQGKERLLVYRAVGYLVGIGLIGATAHTIGIMNAAVALVSLQLLMTVSYLALVSNALGIHPQRIVSALQPSIAVSALTFGSTYSFGQLLALDDWPVIVTLALYCGIAATAWVLGLFIVRHPLRMEALNVRALLQQRGQESDELT